MTCSACSATVEAALESVPGVAHAAVSLIQQEALAEYDPKQASEVLPGPWLLACLVQSRS